MIPNEQWTSDQVEQTLQAFVEEGKVIEFESGKFKPTEKLKGARQLESA